jgi:hypothetical protein
MKRNLKERLNDEIMKKLRELYIRGGYDIDQAIKDLEDI